MKTQTPKAVAVSPETKQLDLSHPDVCDMLRGLMDQFMDNWDNIYDVDYCSMLSDEEIDQFQVISKHSPMFSTCQQFHFFN